MLSCYFMLREARGCLYRLAETSADYHICRGSGTRMQRVYILRTLFYERKCYFVTRLLLTNYYRVSGRPLRRFCNAEARTRGCD